MYGIPNGIARRHIERAAREIDRDGVAHHRLAIRFAVFVDSKSYPPKYLISLAAKYAIGSELSPANFHAHQAVKYFRKLGYRVIDRQVDASKEIAIEDDESVFPEGRERFRLHRHLERDSSIPKLAKMKRLATTVRLECEACGFDFSCAYGDFGDGFIEAHHTVPVSRLRGKAKTKISDLALVCSNCHRMLHRGPLLTVKELRRLIQARTPN